MCDHCYAERRRSAAHSHEEFFIYDECDWCSRRPEFHSAGMFLCARCDSSVMGTELPA